MSENPHLTSQPRYRGRFAPSPTGPLHLGSLLAAVGSFLEARARQGQWLVRMEDIDPPREVAGASDLILRTLETYGLCWDESVLYQSTREEAYRDALDRLTQAELLYACQCSRKTIATTITEQGLPRHLYPGTCRQRPPRDRAGEALRILTDERSIHFTDGLQGRHSTHLPTEVGDFVLRRADGLYAYQLAVVVDDAEQGISHVVRGSDLLDSTPRQLYLQQQLGLASPDYLHLPVIVNTAGEKLSKQTAAPPLSLEHPIPALWNCLQALGQQPPRELLESDLDSFWAWSIRNWNPCTLPQQVKISQSALSTTQKSSTLR